MKTEQALSGTSAATMEPHYASLTWLNEANEPEMAKLELNGDPMGKKFVYAEIQTHDLPTHFFLLLPLVPSFI